MTLPLLMDKAMRASSSCRFSQNDHVKVFRRSGFSERFRKSVILKDTIHRKTLDERTRLTVVRDRHESCCNALHLQFISWIFDVLAERSLDNDTSCAMTNEHHVTLARPCSPTIVHQDVVQSIRPVFHGILLNFCSCSLESSTGFMMTISIRAIFVQFDGL